MWYKNGKTGAASAKRQPSPLGKRTLRQNRGPSPKTKAMREKGCPCKQRRALDVDQICQRTQDGFSGSVMGWDEMDEVQGWHTH